ncbi:hypothetical protein [Dyadobacter sp. NIV53]|uniref:hypothetical protein n=1 Tax=Dyadobacter sp. NIV53 TaxID=2861765 RepID=UPI001C8738A2|nr:hypothetical protein [Dyadobacter sp. NIV53]
MKQLLILTLLIFVLFSCKNDDLEGGFYMTALVNNQKWKSLEHLAGAQLDFSNYANAHNLLLGGTMEKPLGDGTIYRLSTSINSPVNKGKYYFNNKKYESNAIGGVQGNVIGYKNGVDYFNSVTITGFVEITILTDHEVGGNFEYQAVTYNPGSENGVDTVKVKNGRFYVPIVMVSGREWKAPK